jgi:hypothetical protein
MAMHYVFCDVGTEFLIHDEASPTQLNKQMTVYMRLIVRNICQPNGRQAFVAHAIAALCSGQRLNWRLGKI